METEVKEILADIDIDNDKELKEQLLKYPASSAANYDDMFIKIEIPNLGIYGTEVDVWHFLSTLIEQNGLDPMLIHSAVDNIVNTSEHTKLATAWFCKEYIHTKALRIIDTLEQEIIPQKGQQQT